MSAHSTRSDVSGWGSPALSPVVRAGLRVLDAMTAGEFGEVVEQSKPMKPGRKPSS